MRLLVACPQCKRQFDVGSRPVGSRFRCYCGATVTVRQPQGHDAAVVRCSSCGAPRAEGATACKYCGADFTIHEQDLDTVCPQCFARVSDRAKFCHHCGVALRPESLAGEKTELCCPACGKASCLSHRQVGGVALMECQRCAGFWLAVNVLDDLVDKASHGVAVGDFRLRAPPATAERGRGGRAERPALSAVSGLRRDDEPGELRPPQRSDHRRLPEARRLVRRRRTVADSGLGAGGGQGRGRPADGPRRRAPGAARRDRQAVPAAEGPCPRGGGGGWAEPEDTSPNILVVLGEIALELFGWGRWRRW